jgi:hypothetical protein
MKILTSVLILGSVGVTIACGNESEGPVSSAAGAGGNTGGTSGGRAGEGGRAPMGGTAGSAAGRGGNGGSGTAGRGGTAAEGGAGAGGEGGCLMLSAYVIDVENSCVDYTGGQADVDCAPEQECSQDLLCVIRRNDGKRFFGSSSCFEPLSERWALCSAAEDERVRAGCGTAGEGGSAGAN